MGGLELLAATAAQPAASLVELRLQPKTASALDTLITFVEPPQRRRLQLSARTKPVAPARGAWDEGAGGEQWSNLSVSVARKKKRCAECTRPLAEASTSLLCERCVAAVATADSTPTAMAAKPECGAALPPRAQPSPAKQALASHRGDIVTLSIRRHPAGKVEVGIAREVGVAREAPKLVKVGLARSGREDGCWQLSIAAAAASSMSTPQPDPGYLATALNASAPVVGASTPSETESGAASGTTDAPLSNTAAESSDGPTLAGGVAATPAAAAKDVVSSPVARPRPKWRQRVDKALQTVGVGAAVSVGVGIGALVAVSTRLVRAKRATR